MIIIRFQKFWGENSLFSLNSLDTHTPTPTHKHTTTQTNTHPHQQTPTHKDSLLQFRGNTIKSESNLSAKRANSSQFLSKRSKTIFCFLFFLFQGVVQAGSCYQLIPTKSLNVKGVVCTTYFFAGGLARKGETRNEWLCWNENIHEHLMTFTLKTC